MNERTQQAYLSILQEELILATGCTEPIAIAYAAAELRELLGCRPERVRAEVSGNILKNVKSAVVPNTGGLKGIESAIAAGIAAGAAGRGLQVMAEVSEEHTEEILEYLRKTPIEVCCAETPCILDIRLSGWAGENSACVRIANNHTNLVYKARNDEILLDLPVSASAEERLTDKSCLNVEDIVRFADTVDPALLEPVLERQIRYNSAIAEEGIRGGWGAEIGRILLEGANGDIQTEAKAYAAAGSDARMSGCEMPVVILSGSGNQGLAAGDPLRQAPRREPGTAFAGAGAVRPHHHSSENGHRTALGLLRRDLRRRRRWRRHLLFAGRRLYGGRAYGGQRGGGAVWNDLRRREAVLRSEDRRCGGRRNHGLPDVSP